MKPQEKRNTYEEYPCTSEAQGIMDTKKVAAMSMQTGDTAQTANLNPQRLNPAYAPPGPGGEPKIDPNGVMANQTSDITSSAKTRGSVRRGTLDPMGQY